MKLPRGAVVRIQLDPKVGHEQGGIRPCVVVTPSDLADAQRYPILAIVPLTSRIGLGPLYPVLQPYPQGLTLPSTALVDQVRSIDKQRVTAMFAPLPALELGRVDDALRRVLGL